MKIQAPGLRGHRDPDIHRHAGYAAVPKLSGSSTSSWRTDVAHFMEEKDAFGTPEWRPTSSLSSVGLPSTRTSSILSPTYTNTDHASAEFSFSTSPGSVDIAPFETVICDQLIEAVIAETTLQPALQRAKDTLQRHAKWFTQDGLARLLEAALGRAIDSRSTVDLYAALEFVDAVGTFAILPPGSLVPVARFIAYSYYQGTRMNRHKSLAKKAWTVLQHGLQSHLGQGGVSALLAVLRNDDHRQSKAGFAAASGVLRLIEDKLPLGDEESHGVPAVSVFELLPSLKAMAKSGDELLREHVWGILLRMLAEDPALLELEKTASWEVFVDVLEVSEPSADSDGANPLLDAVAQRSHRCEPRSIGRLAKIFLKADHSLTENMAEELLRTLALRMESGRHTPLTMQAAFTLICSGQAHHALLGKLMDEEVASLRNNANWQDWQANITQFQDVAVSEHTPPQSAITITAAFGKLLHIVFSRPDITFSLERKIEALLLAVTHVATTSHLQEARMEALRIMSRLRAAIDGAVYLAGDENLERPYSEPTVPNGIKAITLRLDRWLAYVTGLLDGQATPKDHHLVNYVLATLPEQLSNHSLFYNRQNVPKRLRVIACNRLTTGAVAHSAFHVHMLSVLISYRDLFSVSESKTLMVALIKAAGSSDSVSKACIHALTVCCYEMPDIATNYMDDIIQKMHRMVTQRHLAIHVLEFLTGLSRLPDLYRNFTFDDFKMIFGVCFSYLESLRYPAPETKSQPSDQASSGETDPQQVPQYVHALVYHVIVFWYLATRADHRPQIKEYATSRLKYRLTDGTEIIEDQGLVTIDLMDSVDADPLMDDKMSEDQENLDPDQIFDESDGRLVARHRLFGLLLISTETSLRNGKSRVTVRRPSGTYRHVIDGIDPKNRAQHGGVKASVHTDQPWPSTIQEHGILEREDTVHSIVADDFNGLTYGQIKVPGSAALQGSAHSIELPASDDRVKFAINSFDRTPGLDSHKAGVIYIGEGQTAEADIFLNSSGSPDYREFVDSLGRLARLRGAKFNAQGLDTNDGLDGEYAIVWNSKVTELVYHVTTMMPTDTNDDPLSAAMKKKRHTGNDYVNIVFNNSGQPFDFNMFPSQFNFVYIVITPSVRTTFLQTRTHTMATPAEARFYRVEVLTSEEFPAISSAAEAKVISGASLSGYVRNLALNACVFSEVWVNKDLPDYRSSWRERLNQLRRLRQRYSPVERSDQPTKAESVGFTGKGKGKAGILGRLWGLGD